MRKKLLFIVILLSIFLMFFQGIAPMEKEEVSVTNYEGILILRNFFVYAGFAFVFHKFIAWYFFTRRNTWLN